MRVELEHQSERTLLHSFTLCALREREATEHRESSG
jgi:hypothetical protein